MAINVQVFGERIGELEADRAAGNLSEAQYQAQITELKRQLLEAQTVAEAHALWVPKVVPSC